MALGSGMHASGAGWSVSYQSGPSRIATAVSVAYPKLLVAKQLGLVWQAGVQGSTSTAQGCAVNRADVPLQAVQYCYPRHAVQIKGGYIFTFRDGKPVMHENLIAARAQCGDLAGVQWLRSADPPCEWDENVSSFAAQNGHLHVLQWALQQDPSCLPDCDMLYYAARKGHTNVLQWARQHIPVDSYPKWDFNITAGAACGGHLHALQWARQLNPPVPWNKTTCESGGHLHVLQWARQQSPPCPWDEEVCVEAAQAGHLHVLQWARQQDPPCPWNEEVCWKAACNGHVDVLVWLRSKQPPCPWNKHHCRWLAEFGGHSAVVDWLSSDSSEI